MRKIFDELAVVENMKKNGFTVRNNVEYVMGTNEDNAQWIDHTNYGDLFIMARYLREQGYTEKPMVEEIMKYDLNEADSWEWHSDRQQVRKVCKNVCSKYKKGQENILEIKSIKISQKAKDFFVGLVGKEVVSINGLDRGVKKLGIKEVKTLFVLYCWTLIQKAYKEDYWKYVNLDNCKRAFQQSCRNTWKECWKSICVLYDMGYIKLTNNYQSLTMIIDLDFGDGDIEINNLYELGGYIELWLGKVGVCPNCGEFFVKKARTSKECCEDCRREKNRMKSERYRKEKKSCKEL